MSVKTNLLISLLLAACLAAPESAFPWSPRTHAFMAQKAGIRNPEYAFFADHFKQENKELLGPLHYHNAAPGATITPAYIDRYPIRVETYIPEGRKRARPIRIRVPDPAGALYWKIVEIYESMKGTRGWEYEYHLINLAHYVGDLSNPLHNFPHGDKRAADGKIYRAEGAWARERHEAFDSILESLFPMDRRMDQMFDASIAAVAVVSADDLKREIAQIATAANRLAKRCYQERRLMTVEEALKQTALSVSLLKAVIQDTKEQ